MANDYPDLSSNNFQPGQVFDPAAFWASGRRRIMLKATQGNDYRWVYGTWIADQIHARGGTVDWYHWLTPNDPIASQVAWYVQCIGPHLKAGDRLCSDFEVTENIPDPGDSTRAAQLVAFMTGVAERLPAYARKTYTGAWYAARKPAEQAAIRRYDVHISNYDGDIPDSAMNEPDNNPYGWHLTDRQYTNQGSCAGVPGLCDMNRSLNASTHTPESGSQSPEDTDMTPAQSAQLAQVVADVAAIKASIGLSAAQEQAEYNIDVKDGQQTNSMFATLAQVAADVAAIKANTA